MKIYVAAVVVHVGAVKIYVAAVEALRKKERWGQNQCWADITFFRSASSGYYYFKKKIVMSFKDIIKK
jgi:hypothetical protein